MDLNKFIKIACILYISLYIYSLLLALNSPSIGYESSIYYKTPLQVWVILFLGIIIGVLLVIHQIVAKKLDTYVWILGLFLIILSNTTALSMHIIRGYTLWDAMGDPGAHLSMIQDILLLGHVDYKDFYPITHIYLSQFSQVIGIDPTIPMKLFPLIFYEIYILFIYMMSRFLLLEKGQIIFATLAGTPLIHGWYLSLSPNLLSNLAFPLFLYVFLKSYYTSALGFKIVFLFFIFLYPPFHPVPCIVFIIIVILIQYNIFENRSRSTSIAPNFFTSGSLLLIIFCIAWISSFGIWSATIENLNSLITEKAPSALVSINEKITYADTHGFNVKEYFLKVYGAFLLYLLASIFTLPLFLLRKEKYFNASKILNLYICILAFATIMAIMLFANLPFGPTRLLIYMLILCIVLVGFAGNELFNSSYMELNWFKKIVPMVIAFILITISTNGVLCIYPSPYTFDINMQTTANELNGIYWLFHNKDVNISYTSWYFTPSVFSAFLLKPEERTGRKDLTKYASIPFPYHFGYDKNSTLGNYYDKDRYLVIIPMIKSVYIDTYPNLAKIRLLNGDFETLGNDPNVDKLFHSGSLDIWYIHHKNSGFEIK